MTARQELIWYPWQGRSRAASAGADVYHCPTLRAPVTRGKPPLVLTVHDLVPLIFPETMSSWSRWYTRATLRLVLEAADLIVAVSNNTANDLNRLLKIPAKRIRVVWSGVDEIFFGDARDLSGTKPRDRPYVLFVGTPEPRKNLPRLVEAMRELRSRGFRERLVLAGAGGWGNVRIGENDAESLGMVSDEQLLELYANASCVALPSLYEGFGLTAVEAMAVGVPLVAARAGSLPEITGNAAVLVDPYDVSSIASGLERAIVDREKLIALGRERVADFRWERTAAAMAEVYREIT
jgi:glycosyltransferase involved in cell wall biosynthesis